MSCNRTTGDHLLQHPMEAEGVLLEAEVEVAEVGLVLIGRALTGGPGVGTPTLLQPT